MDERNFLIQVLNGETDAVLLCERLFRASQLIDDLQDQDKPVEQAQRNELFWTLLVTIPENAFYRQHQAQLQPVIRTALNDWLDSNALESGDVHDHTLAFVLRDQLTGLVSQCAYVIGGYDWLRQVSPHIRRYFHNERLEHYLADFEQPADDSTEDA